MEPMQVVGSVHGAKDCLLNLLLSQVVHSWIDFPAMSCTPKDIESGAKPGLPNADLEICHVMS